MTHFLSDDELDAISGGQMNIPRPDFHDQRGVPGSIGQPPNDAGFAGVLFYAFGLIVVSLAA